MNTPHEEWVDLFGERHVTCHCGLCRRGRRVDAVVAGGDVEELRALVRELDEACAVAEAEPELSRKALGDLGQESLNRLRGLIDSARLLMGSPEKGRPCGTC